jgi:UDP-N-acetylmuramoylalanine--D-glutamate ligase
MAKTIAIFGAGQSGQAARRLAKSLGDSAVLFDQGGQGDATVFSAEDIERFDAFVFSPGFAADHPWRLQVVESGRPCLSELAFAAPHWRGSLIGVTGTNGKTTLTKLLADALAGVAVKEIGLNVACPLVADHEPSRMADASAAPLPRPALALREPQGLEPACREPVELAETASEHATFQALAVGNIGYPLGDAVLCDANQPGAYAVVEISSFQAELSQELRLDGLIWTNFAEDHLDRYADIGAYFTAKAQLLGCLKSGACCVVGPSVVPWLEQGQFLAGGTWKRLPGAPLRDQAAGSRIYIKSPRTKSCIGIEPPNRTPPGGETAQEATTLLEQLQADSVFRRSPNSENFNLAAAWWTQSGLPGVALIRAADRFTPAPHRLALVAECGGVRFWDDSKATNFHAALAAIESVGAPIVWIGGGRAKGGDLEAFAQSVGAGVAVAVLYGEAGGALAGAMREMPMRVVQHDRFADAVRAAAEIAAAIDGATVLLSPGFASFDQFDSYSDRGKLFRDVVLGLKHAR